MLGAPIITPDADISKIFVSFSVWQLTRTVHLLLFTNAVLFFYRFFFHQFKLGEDRIEFWDSKWPVHHCATAWWCHFHPWHCLQNGGSFFMIVLRWASLGAKFARLVSSRRWNKSPKDISFNGGEKCQFKLGSWLMAPHLSQYLDRYSIVKVASQALSFLHHELMKNCQILAASKSYYLFDGMKINHF